MCENSSPECGGCPLLDFVQQGELTRELMRQNAINSASNVMSIVDLNVTTNSAVAGFQVKSEKLFDVLDQHDRVYGSAYNFAAKLCLSGVKERRKFLIAGPEQLKCGSLLAYLMPGSWTRRVL